MFQLNTKIFLYDLMVINLNDQKILLFFLKDK